MSFSEEQISKWKNALEEKTKLMDQYSNDLNALSSEILQLQGGLTFAKEAAESESSPEGQSTEEAEEAAPQS